MSQNPYAAPKAAVADVAETGVAMGRPVQVLVAVILMSVAFVVRILIMIEDFGMYQRLAGGYLYIALAFSVGLTLLLIVKVFQGRNWARIVYLLLFCIGVPRLLRDWLAYFNYLPVPALITGAQALASLVALVLVFTSPGRNWFRRESALRRLFSYGTLRGEDVQRALLGRALDGRDDEVVGFELAASSNGAHINVVRSAWADSRVGGKTFHLTDADLAHVDAYERRDGYERIEVTLASGANCWMYVEAAPPG